MHGHLKQLLSNGLIRFKFVHKKHIWLNVSYFSTINAHKGRGPGRNINGNIYAYHGVSRTNLYPFFLPPKNEKLLFLERRFGSVTLPFHSTISAFTPSSLDGDIVLDTGFDLPINENVEDMTEHDSNWMMEFEELKERMNCSEEKLKKVIMQYPDLKTSESLRKVKLNLSVLLKKGVKRGNAFRLLNSSPCVFLLISQDELNNLFTRDTVHKDWYKHLTLYLETRLKGDTDLDNTQFLAQLLNVQQELLLKITRKGVLKDINTRYSAVLLKVKVDFLLSKGISQQDIACNLETLRIKLSNLEQIIDEMEATVGEVSLKIVLSKSRIKSNHRYRSGINKVYKLLGCSCKDFSKLQNDFLNNLNQTDSIKVLDYLLDRGIDKQEVIKNPYILGHKLTEVRYSFEKYVNEEDFETVDQKTLINRMVYDLEYGDD